MATTPDPAQTFQSPVGIVTFAHVWEPFAFAPIPGQAPKDPNYSLILVFPPRDKMSPDSSAAMDDLEAAIWAAAYSKFDETKVADLFARGKFGTPVRPASDYSNYGVPFTNGEGWTFCKFQSNAAPGIVDERAKEIMDRATFYSGCKARVSAYAHPYDTMGNQGVTFLLNNVQKAGDGTPISSKKSATEEFKPLPGAAKSAGTAGMPPMARGATPPSGPARGAPPRAAAPARSAPPRGAPPRSGSTLFDDMDDDIPF